MQNPSKKKPPTFRSTKVEDTLEEQIRTRAYELYEAGGRVEGHNLENWLEAEAEITGRAVATAAA